MSPWQPKMRTRRLSGSKRFWDMVREISLVRMPRHPGRSPSRGSPNRRQSLSPRGAGCRMSALRRPRWSKSLRRGVGFSCTKTLASGDCAAGSSGDSSRSASNAGATPGGGVPSAVAASRRAPCSWARAGPGYVSCHPITVRQAPCWAGGASQRRKLPRPRGEELPLQRQRRPGGESSSSPGPLGLRCRRDRIGGGGPEHVE